MFMLKIKIVLIKEINQKLKNSTAVAHLYFSECLLLCQFAFRVCCSLVTLQHIITKEIIGLSHDHVALFNTFCGATKSCVRWTINCAVFRIKQPSSNYVITYFTIDNRSRNNILNMVWIPLKMIQISLETETTERIDEENKESST